MYHGDPAEVEYNCSECCTRGAGCKETEQLEDPVFQMIYVNRVGEGRNVLTIRKDDTPVTLESTFAGCSVSLTLNTKLWYTYVFQYTYMLQIRAIVCI